jgi:glycosyltransferase involved in cell wall biosynthesis
MTCICSVVICTHNRYNILDEALHSIEMQTCAQSSFELIIVDNSTDIAAQNSFRDGLEIACHHNYIIESTPGLSRARNIGARAAIGEFVAYMDDDAQASPRWIESIIAAFQSGSDIGIVGGPVTPIWLTSRPIWLHTHLEGFLTIVNRGPSKRLLAPHEWLAGTNIAFRKDALIAAGLFNENLGRIGKILLSNEELSVSDKIRSMGLSVLYDPDVAMAHTVHVERLNHAWMRRRVFWQVISDLFSEGASVEMSASDGIQRILDYKQKLSPKDRGTNGLFLDVDDAHLFEKQLDALSSLVRLVGTSGADWQSYLTDNAK